MLSKFEVQKPQFQRTVCDKIDRKTHLEYPNRILKYIFGIFIKFSIQ